MVTSIAKSCSICGTHLNRFERKEQGSNSNPICDNCKIDSALGLLPPKPKENSLEKEINEISAEFNKMSIPGKVEIMAMPMLFEHTVRKIIKDGKLDELLEMLAKNRFIFGDSNTEIMCNMLSYTNLKEKYITNYFKNNSK